MKILSLMTGVLFTLATSATEMNAQQSLLPESNLAAANVDYGMINKVTTVPPTASYRPFYIDESNYGIKAVKSFGSFVIPTTNYLKIVAPDNTTYSNAQLVNKKTGASVFNIKLDGINDTVDMTGTRAGLYILTMSNSEGNIFSEEIMIM